MASAVELGPACTIHSASNSTRKPSACRSSEAKLSLIEQPAEVSIRASSAPTSGAGSNVTASG